MTSGEVPELPGKFGELPGKFGKLPGNLWIVVKVHSERTSGEVAENFGEVRGTSGEVRGLPRSSREPDSLPATRQISLQLMTAMMWMANVVGELLDQVGEKVQVVFAEVLGSKVV